MKKLILTAVIALTAFSNSAFAQIKSTPDVKVTIDLNTIKNDKVMVTVIPPAFKSNEVSFHFPKTVPGTYSDDNYGRFIDNLKAFDKNGKELVVSKTDLNSWKIANAKSMVKITYLVNEIKPHSY